MKHKIKISVVMMKKLLLIGVMLIIMPIMLFLNYYSFRYSVVIRDIAFGSIMLETKDSLVLHCIVGMLFLLIPAVISYLLRFKKAKEQWEHIIIFSIMAITFALCLIWVINGNFFAQNDSRYVLECMERMRNGNYSDLLPRGYIGTYKQHLGLITIFNIIFFFARTTDDIAIQIVNVICVPILIFAGYRVLKELSAKFLMYLYYGMFMLFCFPLFFYTPYVYGEIISLTAGMIFIWASICYLKRGKISAWIVLALCSVVGNMARGNFPILLIAFAIMAILYGMRRKVFKPCLCATSLFLIVFLVSLLNLKYYEHISGVKIDQGIPVVGWIAMGLDEYGELANGMYNGYNIETYVNSGCDSEAASIQFMQYIRDRLSMFAHGVGTSPFAFYKEKLLAQWNDPTFNCFMENRTFIPATNTIIEGIVDVDGKYADIARELLNQYHWLVYMGTLFFCLSLFNGKTPFYYVFIPIILIGGFLFTMIWEAMSRYVLPYAMYMIPISSIGWCSIENLVVRIKLCRKKR